MTGKGAEGRVNGKEIKVVSPGYLRENNIGIADERIGKLSSQGKTVVFVMIDGDLKGAVALADITVSARRISTTFSCAKVIDKDKTNIRRLIVMAAPLGSLCF